MYLTLLAVPGHGSVQCSVYVACCAWPWHCTMCCVQYRLSSVVALYACTVYVASCVLSWHYAHVPCTLPDVLGHVIGIVVDFVLHDWQSILAILNVQFFLHQCLQFTC